MCNQDGWTAFLTAAYKGRTDVLLLLLERGANMEAASNVSLRTACILLLSSPCDAWLPCLCLCVCDMLDSIIHSPLPFSTHCLSCNEGLHHLNSLPPTDDDIYFTLPYPLFITLNDPMTMTTNCWQCGATALMRAEDRGHLDVIKLLVDYTASQVRVTHLPFLSLLLACPS